MKHGLSKDPQLAAAAFVSLALHSSKVVQAAYGVSEIAGCDNTALEAAAALSELLTVRLRDVETTGIRSRSAFDQLQDGYGWLKVTGDSTLLGSFDRFGLRAILAYVRHVTGAKEIAAAVDVKTVTLTVPTDRLAGSAFLAEVAIWADIELRIDVTKVVMVARYSNG